MLKLAEPVLWHHSAKLRLQRDKQNLCDVMTSGYVKQKGFQAVGNFKLLSVKEIVTFHLHKNNKKFIHRVQRTYKPVVKTYRYGIYSSTLCKEKVEDIGPTLGYPKL